MNKFFKTVFESKNMHYRMKAEKHGIISLEEITQILNQDEQLYKATQSSIKEYKEKLKLLTTDGENLAKMIDDCTTKLEQNIEHKREIKLKYNKRKAAVQVTKEVNQVVDPEQIFKKSEDEKEFIIQVLKNSPITTKIPENLLSQLVDIMKPMSYQKDSIIIKEGDIGNEIYLLKSGKCRLEKKDAEWKEKIIEAGTLFGELAIIFESPRIATVVTHTEVELWILHRIQLKNTLKIFDEEQIRRKIHFLKNLPFLHEILEKDYYQIAGAMKEKSYVCGDKIIKEGDPGDAFYIIKDGEVKVLKSDGKFDGFITRLKEGDYFGEQALMTDGVRNAMVVVSSLTCICFQISTGTFKFLVGSLEKKDDKNTKISSNSNLYNLNETKTCYNLKDRKVIKHLGHGHFGNVDLITFGDENLYALKAIPRKNIDSQELRKLVFQERDILFSLNFPFIVRLYQTFRDTIYLYYLMEPYLGGDFQTLLDTYGKLSKRTTYFTVGCMVLAIEHLYKKNIIHRDIKPQNIMIDSKGYGILVDFGFAKFLNPCEKTFTACGTIYYLPPEIVNFKSYDYTRELWSLGILIFLFLTGRFPYKDKIVRMELLGFIRKGIKSFKFPFFMDSNAVDLIKNLCRQDPCKRLGNGKDKFDGIKNHSWFSDLNWTALEQRKYLIQIEIEDMEPEEYTTEQLEVEVLSDWDVAF